jgi:hypothetical protein
MELDDDLYAVDEDAELEEEINTELKLDLARMEEEFWLDRTRYEVYF